VGGLSASVRHVLTHVSATEAAAVELSELSTLRDGTGTDVIPPITTTWMMRQGQCRQVLGTVLSTMRNDGDEA
jgi:hypothetical protein